MYDEKISEGAELAEYQSNMNQFDRYKIPAKILKLANRCTDLLVEKFKKYDIIKTMLKNIVDHYIL